MDQSTSQPGSPGGPLLPLSLDRMNHQRDLFSSIRTCDNPRESLVHEKISQFNSLAMQSKQLERKTADAALKRAMLGREEAESDMRRYRDEVKGLRKLVEEGRERERRVGERLETVMDNYGRAKETHAHTQALWEKEIRRARKETFKAQSISVKLQEEIKMLRSSLKMSEEGLVREKDRSRAREQEAFTARYQMVGLQEQLEQALERIKVVEQERDAFKTIAKNEEVARIAAEGCIPLPSSDDASDEFASPRKSRVSLSTVDIVSSAASEEEIEELTRLLDWERQRANRALEHIEFLKAECDLQCCPCAKHSTTESKSPRPLSPQTKADECDASDSDETLRTGEAARSLMEAVDLEVSAALRKEDNHLSVRLSGRSERRRTSTVFCPQEGIFRTVPIDEAEDMESMIEEADATAEPPTPSDVAVNPRIYARTPSVEPPSFAMMAQERTSLLSLLNAPHRASPEPCNIQIPVFTNIPTIPSMPETPADLDSGREVEQEQEMQDGDQPNPCTPEDARGNPMDLMLTNHDAGCMIDRPHTSTSFYAVTTTTTTVPLRDDNSQQEPYASFDINNPAMTPTMTREQALAQIRERRGRARSAAQAAATPKRRILSAGKERRDMSAPVGQPIKQRART